MPNRICRPTLDGMPRDYSVLMRSIFSLIATFAILRRLRPVFFAASLALASASTPRSTESWLGRFPGVGVKLLILLFFPSRGKPPQ